MVINDTNRGAIAKVYTDYLQLFLDEIIGSLLQELLIRDEDVQVLNGFDSVENLDVRIFTVA